MSAPDARYDGRKLDVAAMLAAPDDPQPWIVDRLAARGAVTVIAGAHGCGKSAAGVSLASRAQAGGGVVAGLLVEPTPAIVLDAEQGPRVAARRVRALRVHPRLGYVDCGGLDVRNASDAMFIVEAIKTHGAGLVIVDSLRRLAPGVDENSGADMVPVMERWAAIARHTDAAVILLAHRGKDGTTAYRGHTTIGDVADAVFVLEHVEGDDDTARRRLRNVKMRLDEEPEDRWLALTALPFAVEATAPYAPTSKMPKARAGLADTILAAAQHGPITTAEMAAATGRRPKDGSLRRAREALVAEGLLEPVPDAPGNNPAWRVPNGLAPTWHPGAQPTPAGRVPSGVRGAEGPHPVGTPTDGPQGASANGNGTPTTRPLNALTADVDVEGEW